MIKAPLLVLAGLAVAGCSTQGTGGGESYNDYLRSHANQTAPVAAPVAEAAPNGSIGADTLAALRATAPGAETTNFAADPMVDAAPAAPIMEDAVSSGTIGAPIETIAGSSSSGIASGAMAPASAGSVAAIGLSTTGTSGTGGPNLAAYALAASNAPGQAIWPRGGVHLTPSARACARYVSSDLAQMAFLEKGGPQKDALNLDPDGDGYACGWDPRPFQLARQ